MQNALLRLGVFWALTVCLVQGVQATKLSDIVGIKPFLINTHHASEKYNISLFKYDICIPVWNVKL